MTRTTLPNSRACPGGGGRQGGHGPPLIEKMGGLRGHGPPQSKNGRRKKLRKREKKRKEMELKERKGPNIFFFTL